MTFAVCMGDKGYDADAILADLQARGIAAVRAIWRGQAKRTT